LVEDLPHESTASRFQVLRARLADHPLYDTLHSNIALRIFMEHHVYAVWDFMSLVKSLQALLAPSSVPWTPAENPAHVHLINQLVLEEESDLAMNDSTGYQFASHFESYCQAMLEVGANMLPITKFIRQVKCESLEAAMRIAAVPEPAKRFVSHTFNMIRNGKPHQLAALLAYGRESQIPQLFQSILDGLQTGPDDAPLLHRYLRRHIELDGDEHGPLTIRLVENLCGGSIPKQNEVMETAADALQARLDFWDGIYHATSVQHI
jgi:hypothetical protein